MSDTKKNFLYNVLYQILLLVTPLITAPYISRVLGAEKTGIYSYTYSIAYYFVLFAMLGINNYGNRLIAKNRDNQEKLNVEFSSLFLLHLILSLISLIVYIIYILFFVSNYKSIAVIQTMYVLSAIFDVNWFFFGIEKFKITVFRSTAIKILSILLLFIMVKGKNDLPIYTIIMAGSSLLSQILIWPYLKKYVKFVKVDYKDIKKHIKPCTLLFIPVIAISLYNIMDKIMIGNQSTMTELGYYENAEKIIYIPLSIITALGTIMLPKMSNLIANSKEEILRKYISKSFDFVLFSSCALCFGLLGISSNFIPFYLGTEFEKTAILIEILSITIVFKAFANVIRTQYLIPKEKDKEYITSVILGAVINLIANYFLINKFYSIGAAIATVLAEFVVMAYQMYAVKNELKTFKEFIKGWKYFVFGLLMAIIVYYIGIIIDNKILAIIMQIIVGAGIYIFSAGIFYLRNNIDSLSDLPIIKKIKIERRM